MLTKLQGQIEKITYTNKESGFTIAKVRVDEQKKLITVVGKLISPTPGEVLVMRGEWANHPKYGKQFQLLSSRSQSPSSTQGIQTYLGSGLIKGIGPVLAERIVEKFGQNTLSIVDHQLEKLGEIEGIGRKRLVMIKQAWKEQKEIREVMLFLQSYGISSGYATKIFKHYGDKSIEIVQQNPYRLASEISGIGFLRADQIAGKMGFEKHSQQRVLAGILYVLHQFSDSGHVFYPYRLLVAKSEEVLQINKDYILQALDVLCLEKQIIIEKPFGEPTKIENAELLVYLSNLYFCEVGVSQKLKNLKNTPKSIRKINSQKAIDWVQDQLTVRLANKQIQAILCAIQEKIMVITGGPGTGKTTIINAILKIFLQLKIPILLAAPTGRAAKRMTETTGYEAKTIHRILEYSFSKGGFQKNEKNLLKCELMIVDEASMIDTVLMHHLLKALSPKTTLILVGDINQLPSVGPGSVLNDIIASGLVQIVKLSKIFRQAQNSSIIVNAHKINRGIMPSLKFSEKTLEDFYFIEQEDPQEVVKIILELAQKRIPEKFGLDPLNDIQVLTPMHKGIAGATNLNNTLQEAFNPVQKELLQPNQNFRINDKVMQIRNNYDKEVFNGDIGRIQYFDSSSQQVIISFYGRKVVYNYTDLDEIVLAYAVSIHKSQGSEYPAVIIPILTQHYVLLQRNLIYTAVTRGKNLVVMVGTSKALAIGVHDNKTQKRYSHLHARLQ